MAVLLLVSPCANAGAKYKVLHSFTGGKDGGGVFAGVALDKNGNLYGATTGGGAYGYGTVFNLVFASGKWTKTIIHDFCANFPDCSDGALPSGTPVTDSAGNIYGASNTATFELTLVADRWRFIVLYPFGSSQGVVMDQTDDLYEPGGPGKYKAGDVFELIPGSKGWTQKVIYNFTGKNGDCCPFSGLTLDASANIYGTTKFGGIGNGTIYQIVRRADGTGKEVRLHNFQAGSDGQYPYGDVVLDSSGNVYGTTLQGGKSNQSGTVFKLTPQSDGHWKETILYDFPNYHKNGAGPAGGMVFDRAGNLYGTTSGGGAYGAGVVFKLVPVSDGKWKYTVLHTFTGKDGWSPQANLIFDKSYKHLYGTTIEGGAGGYGVVFQLTP